MNTKNMKTVWNLVTVLKQSSSQYLNFSVGVILQVVHLYTSVYEILIHANSNTRVWFSRNGNQTTLKSF